MIKDGGLLGSPFLYSGLVAGDGLGCIHTSTVAVHTLKIRVTEGSKGRYPPGGVEGEELLQGKRNNWFMYYFSEERCMFVTLIRGAHH